MQERVRTITRIKVSPDGTKETTTETVSNKDTTVSQENTKLMSKKTWTVFGTVTSKTIPNLEPVYGVGVTKDVLLGIKAGIYANTNGELGLALSYSF